MNALIDFASDLLKSCITLYVVVDPIGMIPIVASLTEGMDPVTKRKNSRTVIYTGSALLIVFALVGQQLLSIFGISIYSFMIAGGILLLLISLDILFRGGTSKALDSSSDIGAVPIAFPLLVGPGAITTTIVILQASGPVIVLLSILVVMCITWLVLENIDKLHRLLGRTGSDVVAKLMAVFLAAIAIQYILRGTQFYYPSK